jgi:transposase-like protein
VDPRGFPTTLPEFQRVFPDPQACAAYLEKLRWPDGFACPRCGVLAEPYRFAARPHVLRCRSCQSDVSLTAATVMDHTHTPLSTWFWAAYLVTTQTPGQSAVQFQRQLGLSRYETAYQILHKLRAGMVRPERDTIGSEHAVEVDECLVGGKTKGEGRGVHHKALVIGAVETRVREADGKKHKRGVYAGRLRLQVVRDRKAPSCEGFVRDNVTRGALVRTDGWNGYDGLTVGGWRHHGLAINADHSITDAHLPMIHIVFSNLKSWILGTHHGISAKHLQSYLNEFTFRFNRRFYPMIAFNSVLGLAVRTVPPTYESLYSGVWVHPGGQPQSPQIEMPFA